MGITWCYKNWSKNLITVDWDTHIGDNIMVKDIVMEHHFSPMEAGVDQLQAHVMSVKHATSRHHMRIQRVQKLSKRTVNRQTWFKLAQALACIVVVMLQAAIIVRNFESK